MGATRRDLEESSENKIHQTPGHTDYDQRRTELDERPGQALARSNEIDLLTHSRVRLVFDDYEIFASVFLCSCHFVAVLVLNYMPDNEFIESLCNYLTYM